MTSLSSLDTPFDAQTRAQLSALMRAHGLNVNDVTIKPLSGGQSNPTYLLTSSTQDVQYVLRKKPDGALLPSAHAIDREYRVMKALQGSNVPVPDMGFYEASSDLLGTPFYIMRFLKGRVLFDQALPELSVSHRAAIYDDLNRVMAALHTIDPHAVGLGDYGRAGNYFERQIGRWSKQYLADPGDRIVALEKLIDVLPHHIPQDDLHAIVHGDFRLDNVVLHPTEPHIIGVLDWELSTLGHPVADFAYHCMSWHIPPHLWRGIGGLDWVALGIPTERDYVARYAQRTGFDGIQAHWDFYLAYNFFRIAAILHGIGQRVRQGNAASPDALDMAGKAEPLAQIGWQYAQRLQGG